MPEQTSPRHSASEEPSEPSVSGLTKESITEILAEALFRASNKHPGPVDLKPPQTETAEPTKAECLTQIKTDGKKRVSVNKTASAKNSRSNGPQAKKKLAAFQKLQKQLTGQLEQLEELLALSD